MLIAFNALGSGTHTHTHTSKILVLDIIYHKGSSSLIAGADLWALLPLVGHLTCDVWGISFYSYSLQSSPNNFVQTFFCSVNTSKHTLMFQSEEASRLMNINEELELGLVQLQESHK